MKKTTNLLVPILFALFSLWIFFYAVHNPAYNWDMIPYVAAVKSFEIHDKKTLHDYVYTSLKENVPPATYAELTTGDYRKAMSINSDAFAAQMPFYTIRVLYIDLIFLLNKIGVNIFVATYLLSALSTVAGLWFLFFAFKKYITPLYFIPFLYFAFLFNVGEIAQLSTPDGMAFLAFAAIIYALLEQKRTLFVLLPLAIFVRTDLIVFVGLVSGYLFLQNSKWRWHAALAFLVSALIYVMINSYYGNYGLATLISFVFVERVAYPAQMATQIHLHDYLAILIRETKNFFQQEELRIYIGTLLLSFLGFLISYKKRESHRVHTRIAHIVILTFLYLTIHFVLYPVYSLRFFVAPYLVSILGFLYFAQSKTKSGSQSWLGHKRS